MNLEETYYIRTGAILAISNLHVRSDRSDGGYDVAPASGGWVKVVPQQEFDANFSEVPRSEIADLQTQYQPARLTFADDGDEYIEGFVNDERWNGWRLPLFTRDALLASQHDGLLSGQSGFLQIVDEAETQELFMALNSDETLADGLTVEQLSSALGDLDYVEVGNDQIWRLRPLSISCEGEDVLVYDTSGVGWTWMIHPDHDHVGVPSVR
ncbi:hypothetical protein G6L37_03815 [Agrobacterium rubi]|nr:hypothetical protein [Agrobacterium rubi]NTF24476.1 hypothetical protein [Agrobacterium rubi]